MCEETAGMTFPDEEDPFNSVQKEVQTTWDVISDEYQALIAGDKDSDGEVLRNKLHTLEWDIQDLEETVRIAKENPAKFKLSPSQVSIRERFVSEMAQKAQRMHATLAASSNPHAQGRASGADREVLLELGTQTAEQKEARGANDDFIHNEVQQQERIMEQQDEDLDHLASAVERIGLMGHEMHEELAEHGQLLDGLADDMDNTRSRMANVRERLDRFIAETGPKQFCTIVGLSVTLLILTFLVATT